MNLRITRGEEILSDIRLSEGDYIIGSGDSAQLRIESEFLAPEHARLRIGTSGVEVEDLGSGRETWLGELALVGVQPLPFGRVLQLGDIAFQVWEDESPAVAREPAQSPGRYIVGPVVAAGAMGVIHSAREVHTGREVAMKQMKSGRDAARFVQEAKITAHLEHPNIVPVHDVNPGSQGASYYTMKMVRGLTLEQLLKKVTDGDAMYPLETLLTIFQKLCDAMAFAHSKGVIHRDLKPANIMLGEYGEVLVMDWGLAKAIGDTGEILAAVEMEGEQEGGGALTISGTIMGTPQYMAPEQACGDHEFVNERSDVYALGAILYELLTLKPPVDGSTIHDVLRNVIAGKLVPPAERVGASALSHLPGGRMPNSLIAVAMKALSLSPDRRYSTVKELQAEVAAYQGGKATGAERAGLGRQLALLVGRNKGVFAVGGAAAAALVALAAIFVFRLSVEKDRARDGEERAMRNAVTAQDEKRKAEASAKLAQDNETKAKDNYELAMDQERRTKLTTRELQGRTEELQVKTEELEQERETLTKQKTELLATLARLNAAESKAITATMEKDEAKKAEMKALETKVTKRLADLAPETDAAAQSGDFGKVLVNSVFLVARELSKGATMNRSMLTVHQRRIRAALGQMPRLLFVRGGPSLARISPDASRVALFEGGKGTLFDTEGLIDTGILRPKGTPIDYLPAGGIDGAEFSGNSSLLFTAFPVAVGEYSVRLWSARSGVAIRTDPANPKISGAVESFLPFPDRSKVAIVHTIAGAAAQQKEVSVWDLDSAVRKASGRFAMNGVTHALLPVPRSGTFTIQSLSKGASAVPGGAYNLDPTSLSMRIAPAKESPISQAIAFSPDGRRMVRLAAGQLGLGGNPLALTVIRGTDTAGLPLRAQAAERQLLIDATTGTALPNEIVGGESMFSPDSQWLLVGAGEKAALHDARTNDPTRKLELELSGPAGRMAFSTDSARAIIATEAKAEPERGFQGASIAFWNTRTGRRANPDVLLPAEPKDISISADGRYLLATGDAVTLWDAAPTARRQPVDFEKIAELDSPAIWVSADARRAVAIPVNSLSPNLNLRAYDLTGPSTRFIRSQILQLPPESSCWLTGNGRFFLVWGKGYGARLWDIDKNAERPIFKAEPRTVKRAYSEFIDGRGVVVIESPTDTMLGLVAEGAKRNPNVDAALIFQGEVGTPLDAHGSLTDRFAWGKNGQHVHDLDGEITLQQTAVKLKLEGAMPPGARRAIYTDDKKLVAILCTSAAEAAIPCRILSPLIFAGELAALPAEQLSKRENRDYRLRNVSARTWHLHVYDVETGACVLGDVSIPALVAFRWDGTLAIALSGDGKWTEIDLAPDTRPIEDLGEIATLLTGRALDKSTGTVVRSQLPPAAMASVWSRLFLKYKDRGWQAEDRARPVAAPR